MEFGDNQSITERIVFRGICAVLVFAPLAFGSVHVWAYSLVEVTVFSLMALYFLDKLVFERSTRFEWVKTPVNWVLLLIFAIIVLQVLPIPLSWIKALSPVTAADKVRLFDILENAGREASTRAYLAYYRQPVFLELLKLATYVGMFFLVLSTAKSKKNMNTLVWVFICVGLFETVYAVYQVFSAAPRVWWWISRAGGGRYASGTYIGSNHFAGYLEMLIPLTFGFMIAQKRNIRNEANQPGNMRPRIQKVVAWFSPEAVNIKMIFLFFLMLIMGVGLLLSASRGGIISFGIASIIISITLFTKKRFKKYGGWALIMCLIMVLYGSNVGIDKTFKKFDRLQSGFDRRLYTFQSMVPMLDDYPALGVGWGNFKYLYPRYVPVDYDGVSTSGYSHNDWLEAGTEIGIIGGGLFLIGFGAFLFAMIRVWRKRRDSYAIGIGVGTIGAVLAMGIHSLFDFNMHIPANPLTLAALSGLGFAAVNRKRHGVYESFLYKTRKLSLTPLRRIVFIVFVMIFLGAGLWGSGRHFRAELKCPTEWNSTLNLNWDPPLSRIKKAISMSPENAELYWKEAWYYLKTPIKDEVLRKEVNESAVRSLENAVRLNPASGSYWFYLGKRYSFRSYEPAAYLKKWLPLADQCFDAAVSCAPRDRNILFDVAWYWVWRSGILPEKSNQKGFRSDNKDSFREDGIKKFQELFQRSLRIDSERWQQAVDRVWEYFPDDVIVAGIVPLDNRELIGKVLRYIAKKNQS